MTSPGNHHRANCIGAISFPIQSSLRTKYDDVSLSRSFEFVQFSA